MSAVIKAVKYAAIGRVSVRSHLAYMADFLIRSLFLLLILYIFLQLWNTTFAGEGTSRIAGYSLAQMIWYLIFTETVTMACPSLSLKIEEEVKSGEVGYNLIRPMNYIGFHFAGYLGEVYVRFFINLAAGSLLGLCALGAPSFGWGWAGFAALTLGAFAVNFMLNMLVALCAFWVEETRGLEFVYHKLLFTVGGMLMPLEVFPEVLRKICEWLPFQAVLYFPAKTAVAFEAGVFVRMLGIQLAWTLLLALLAAAVYRKGVKKLHVNGG